MLAALVHERIVAGFVAAYVDQYDRRGILGGPARERELAETVGREILLAMIVEVREVLPAFFGKKQIGKLKSEEVEAIDAFSREMLAALGRAQNWNGEDRKQFRRDLTLYSDFSARQEMRGKSSQERKGEGRGVSFCCARGVAARSFHAGAGPRRGAKIPQRRGTAGPETSPADAEPGQDDDWVSVG